MNQLTEQELKTLREVEDILFNHIDYETDGVFDKAFYYLYKALRSYYDLERSDE